MGIALYPTGISEVFKKDAQIDFPEEISQKWDSIIKQVQELANKYGITEIYQKLEAQLFDLQKEVIEHLNKDRVIENFDHTVLKEEAEVLEEESLTESSSSDLEKMMADVLSVLYTIHTEKTTLSEEDKQILSSTKIDEGMGAKKLEVLARLFPYFEEYTFVNFVKLSLYLEFLLIVSDRVIDESINNISQDELRRALRDTAERVAIYWIELGAWEPREEDETQLIRNIKIRASYNESISRKTVA